LIIRSITQRNLSGSVAVTSDGTGPGPGAVGSHAEPGPGVTGQHQLSDPGRAEHITQALHLAAGGDRSALDALLPVVYDELRQIAAQHMAGERTGHTLQATAVVHEAYFRLVGQRNLDYKDRGQFFAAAANAIRRILVDHARARGSAKRGGGGRRVDADEAGIDQIAVDASAGGQQILDLLDLDEALERFARLSPRAARVVEMRYFAGMSLEETAEALGVSRRTAADDWALAKAWLHRALGGEGGAPAGTEVKSS
jgi:RNA polymerase sigma factor (TIGR02999 family)